MDRGTTAAYQAQMAASRNRPIHLVELAFDAPTGTIYLTSAPCSVAWGGQTYLGLGGLLGVGDVTETVELVQQSVSVSLTGVDQTYIALLLTEDYLDRPLRIYRGFIDDAGAVVVDPCLMFEGGMDNPVIEEDPSSGTCVVGLEAVSAQVGKGRLPGRHTNHEEQQFYFPGDKAFEFVSAIARDVTWGGRA